MRIEHFNFADFFVPILRMIINGQIESIDKKRRRG